MYTINSATLTGTFQLMTTGGGLPVSIKKLRFINGSNETVIVSYDGVTAHDAIIPAWIIDPEIFADSSNGYDQGWQKGTNIYVRGTAGTGFFYIAGYYQPL